MRNLRILLRVVGGIQILLGLFYLFAPAFFLEAIGYTDVSDVKDRGYFDSIYIRTPSGAMFEATVSHNPGFTCDEPVENLGMDVMVSPNIEQNKQELMSQIGFLKD